MSGRDPLQDLTKVGVTLTSVTAKLKTLSGGAVNRSGVLPAAEVELKEAVQLHANATDQLVSKFFLHSWMTVMLVTFAEAYLEDVLDALISAGLASSALPQDVNDEIKLKWIRETLRGKPREWIKQLKRLGVTGFGEDLGRGMEEVWQRRHKIVHGPHPKAKPTFHIGHMEQFVKDAKIVNRFVEVTDAFACNRLSPFDATQEVQS
jgi:hypothetical protein